MTVVAVVSPMENDQNLKVSESLWNGLNDMVNIFDFFNGKKSTHELDERRGFDEEDTCE
jgi:hypothetical protein